ncbi:MAG: hypothetical protein QOE08_1428 [Thermoleophilaceae bacterium]|nr:hypothetical protein [Thermoleophilaceae bacterium]
MVLRHGLLVLAVAALGAAGLRAASLAAPDGLARAVSGIVLAAAVAVAESLLLGLFGIGSSAAALTLAAVATWAAVRALTPAPALSPAAELWGWWRDLDLWPRVAMGALAGAFAAWLAWLVRHPALGHDMVLYHLPEAVGWVHDGRPGSVEHVITGVPVGNYPLTHEVLLAWGMSISRGFVWVTAVTAAMPALIALAGWLGLRTLGVGRAARALAVTAIVATPAVIASQNGGASLDPAALAWLTSCAALCAAAAARPTLLVPAVLAAGLAIGTKTTAAPLGVAVLAFGGWRARGALRPLAVPLAAAAAGAVAVGGVWYLRNLFSHGSPLWPFVSAPWGDPRPPLFDAADVRFIHRAGDTLDRLGSYYLHHFGGPIVLLAGALAAAVMARSRAVTAAAVAAGLSVLIWADAPFTGVVDNPAFDIGTGDATRYLLPGAAAAAAALALASRRPGWVRRVALALLAIAAVVSLGNSGDLGFPSVPSTFTPLAGAAIGAALAALSRVRGVRQRLRLPGPAARAGAAVVVAAAVALAGAAASRGFVERHGATGTSESGVAAWFAAQPEWRDGDGPVRSTWSLVGTLTGDHMEHRLELVSAREGCRRVTMPEPGAWVVLDRREAARHGLARCAGAPPPPYSDDVYEAYAPPFSRVHP